MRALDFLAAHNLTHGKLNLTNIWVSRAGKVIIGMLPRLENCLNDLNLS